MGVSVHYRGSLADLSQIENFEDRVIDFALEVGGQFRLWRTWADDNPERMVRGLIVELAPGHESTSMLVSPEGWLINLVEIEDAEEGRITEPPWCATKTQFGSVEAHVALVEMLAGLKREFLLDLEVSDEGEYWEKRDLAELIRRRSLIERALDGLTKGLKQYGLSREAMEDPDILATRVERIAALVHRTLRRPAEHAPVDLPDHDDIAGSPDLEATEKLWDEIAKQNRRQQEQLHRAVAEQRSRGVKIQDAIRDALRGIVPEVPDEESSRSKEAWHHDQDRAISESLEHAPEDEFESEVEERHPLLEQVMDYYARLNALFRDAGPQFAHPVRVLNQGMGESVGGLAQALSHREDDGLASGLRIVQLKRALRGAAFAHGALYPLRAAVTEEQSNELFRELKQIEEDITSELGKARSVWLLPTDRLAASSGSGSVSTARRSTPGWPESGLSSPNDARRS